ncbi:hypothetical protein GCM10010464_03670 [Pseudonocardia yunnanensis]|uniref:DUF397 domain-containing protein n=1 Tax=Pseudonocardia yunnanensis TaxID=58107 RepID=A0ABW4EWG7_9PSEU
MPDSETPEEELFIRSSFSTGGNCVEVASRDDRVVVRHSRHREQGTLVFSQSEWTAFVLGVKHGEFDYPSPK